MIVIKTSQEASYRVVLKIIEAIRYGNLYQELEEMKKLTEKVKQ